MTIRHYLRTAITCSAIGFILSSTVVAQEKPELTLTIQDQKVNLSAAERSGRAETAFTTGDTILYTITAANSGDGLMRNPSIIDPVPDNVEYIPFSATGANAQIQYSIDGGSTYHAWPVMYETTDAGGKKVNREATPAMITHIRWKLDTSIPPGESRKLSFRVVVE